MWTTNNLKSKIIYTIHYFDKGHLKAANNTNFDTKIEKYSCWSILFIDKLKNRSKKQKLYTKEEVNLKFLKTNTRESMLIK